MEQTWRWYGPNDPITLSDIRQTGATGIVNALHEVPIGQVWPLEAIQARKALIEASSLKWSVVESIPVHESIKTGKICEAGNSRQFYINAYKQSIIHMAKSGLDILCYNFMPVVDWTRTDLEFEWTDGSQALKFDFDAFTAFDIFLLKRLNAAKDYSEEQVERARKYFSTLLEKDKEKLVETIVKGLPGRTSQAYTMKSFLDAVQVRGTKNLYNFKSLH